MTEVADLMAMIGTIGKDRMIIICRTYLSNTLDCLNQRYIRDLGAQNYGYAHLLPKGRREGRLGHHGGNIHLAISSALLYRIRR